MTEAPLVSVLMPAYNHGAYVDQAVSSVLAQTAADLELVAFDDGSSDDTHERLLRWQDRDARVRVFQHPGRGNRGLAATLRASLDQAHGSFIGLIASDDLWFPKKLEQQLGAMAERGGWCYALASYIDTAGQSVSLGKAFSLEGHEQIPLDVELCDNQIVALTVLIRRTLLDSVGGFNPEAILDDFDLWLRLLCVERPVYVDAVVGQYRLSANGLYSSIQRERRDLDALAAAVRSLVEWADLPPEHAPIAMSWLRCHTAVATLARGDWRQAVKTLQPPDSERLRRLLEVRFGRVRTLVGVGPLRMFLEQLIQQDEAYRRQLLPLLLLVRPRSHVRDLIRFAVDRQAANAWVQARTLISMGYRSTMLSQK
jgi:Glycosyl transferase family 2